MIGENILKDKTSISCYQVGGSLRDELLGAVDPSISVKDRDWVVVGATTQEMLDVGFKQIGKNFPVFLHPNSKEEYALARTEKKVKPGHQGFTFNTKHISLNEDLLRRDLTINALARINNHSEIIDPYDGLNDLKNKKLRHLSDAFVEDPLRVFRVARFHAYFAHLGFTVDPKTIALMRTMCQQGELNHLSPERIWKETELALLSHSPRQYFQTLHMVGALNPWFIEINNLFGVPQPPKWHPEIDCGVHTMMVLEHAAKLSPDLRVRFAALTHDLGKSNTPKHILPSHYGHEKRGVDLVKNLCSRLKIPKGIDRFAQLSCRFHTNIHHYQMLTASTYLKLFEAVDYFRNPDALYHLLVIGEADSRGRTGCQYKPYPQKQFWLDMTHHLSQINPTPDLLNLPPEKRKDKLRQIRIHSIQSFLNNYDSNP